MAGEWLDFLSGLVLEKLQWDKITVEGEAATDILRQAETQRVDLIVVGTHGRPAWPICSWGSVAEKVVRRAAGPVLTIRPEAFQFEMP